MKTSITSSFDLYKGNVRLDGFYHACDGAQIDKQLRKKEISNKFKIRDLKDVCIPDGVYIPGRFKRIFVKSPKDGAPYLTGGDILKAQPLDQAKRLSYRFTTNINNLELKNQMILITCSGSIGNSVYVNPIFDGAVGSPDLIRVLSDDNEILSGYLYAFLNSSLGKALIIRSTYGGVIPHIEAHHIFNLPVPRIGEKQERQVHDLIMRSSSLRVEADHCLKSLVQRFYVEALVLNDQINWICEEYHDRSIGKALITSNEHRLDAFHYIGYVGEAEKWLPKSHPMGDLVNPYLPPMFKRPYTDATGIPFLSGIDLYDSYPMPHMYISKKMEKIELYFVKAGTVLVQKDGQRYGLFGRPTILPNHLDQCAVTQHMMRVYPKETKDRGFIYIWLGTEIGRRLLLKQSFGTSMGILDEKSFRQMPVPDCSPELRHSFEPGVQLICRLREEANSLENQAHSILANELGLVAEEQA